MNEAFLKIIKRFLPLIQEKAVPSIVGILNEWVDEVQLQDGEDSSIIVLSKDGDEWWGYVATTNPDNQIKRIIKNIRLDELIEAGLNNLDKIC